MTISNWLNQISNYLHSLLHRNMKEIYFNLQEFKKVIFSLPRHSLQRQEEPLLQDHAVSRLDSKSLLLPETGMTNSKLVIQTSWGVLATHSIWVLTYRIKWHLRTHDKTGKEQKFYLGGRKHKNLGKIGSYRSKWFWMGFPKHLFSTKIFQCSVLNWINRET